MGGCVSKLDSRLQGKRVVIVGGSLAGIKVRDVSLLSWDIQTLMTDCCGLANNY